MMKQSLRNEIVSLKKSHSKSELQVFSAQIFEHLVQTEVFKKAKCVLAYYSFKREVYTHDFVEQYSKRKKIILPVVEKDILVLREYRGKDSLRLSDYGILEPTGPDFTNYSEIDLAIIPGVVFDRSLNRIGRGKGYYDKLLPLLDNAYLTAVCFSFQVKKSVPVEPHDYKMDCIVTEDEIIL